LNILTLQFSVIPFVIFNNKTFNFTHLSLIFPMVRGATTTADTVPLCDDDDDDCHDDERGGALACLDEDRRYRRARDGETMLVKRVVTQRYGDQNPSTTPSLADTNSGRSGFPGVPSFWRFFFQKPTIITEFKNQNK
jgi:hypothetical protein